ncbi:MAG: HEAT repeat domain-containing protein, partial [Planctomycetaceae bacterium]|nr:HEAT repeat domain-containing protein [Planctomycetaceae bacterium]
MTPPTASPSSGRHVIVTCFILLLMASSFPAGYAQQQAENPFALGVRNTEPVSPEEQAKMFHLPPGFRIDLVAAEPQIAKPMNLAFDAQGRLWVSSSQEYPFPAAEGTAPRDTIRILEDTNGDFRADKVTTFADQLNIPIGLYPWRDGVICFSIPNILLIRDTDHDGIGDSREVLYGPFDTTRDTHGMCNAFRRGDDGWVYACHGFNNQSVVKGRDGHTVSMASGNTFRFRTDGSRIEHFTHGQVNPFGMAVDLNGDVLTADCHTKPITLLLQDGYYESFGKPHDGLGFVPNVMDHLHGSTAIAAIALGQVTAFPDEYQDHSFGGNVMTSRINSNQLQHHGSTVRAVEVPDFLSCDDPWFRPVDIVTGPDGALYVADFYNRIIGHYEVDLHHPGRDRFRGRIWRVSYVGEGTATQAGFDVTDLTTRTAPQLVDQLTTVPEVQARLIADRLSDMTTESERPLSALTALLKSESPAGRRRALWLLHRFGNATLPMITSACKDSDTTVRIHGFRVLNATPAVHVAADETAELLKQGMQDPEP